MPLVLSIVTILLLGQFDAGAAGMEPYVFVERGEEAGRLYVLVEPEDLKRTVNPFIVMILDEPWLPIEQRRLNLRIDEGWKTHGSVQVDTREGLVWIHKEESEFARRAEEMAAAARGGETVVSAPAPGSAGDAAREPLGFWMEWGVHAAIIAGAALLAAVVIWATLVRGPWTALRS